MMESLIAKRLRLAVIATASALIGALIIWRARTGLSIGDVVLIVVLTLPVCIALPKLQAGNRRAYAWMTLAVTPFLILAITESVANPASRAWAAVCLLIAFLLFVLLIAYLRVTRGRA